MKSDFCRACGASIPPRKGEGTCEVCDHEHCYKGKIKHYFKDKSCVSTPKRET
jgi:hypothetical protein